MGRIANVNTIFVNYKKHMQKRVKVIQLPQGNVQKIMKAYGVSETLVFNALAYRSNSLMAEKIRKDAVENYGGVHTTRLILR